MPGPAAAREQASPELLLNWLYVTVHADGRVVLEPRTRHAQITRDNLRRLGENLEALSREQHPQGPPVHVYDLARELGVPC